MKATRGLTLIELVVVLALVALLATLSAPSLAGFFDRQRIVRAGTQLYGDLQYARTESIRRNKTVRMCFEAGSDWAYEIRVAEPAAVPCSGATAACGCATDTVLKSADASGTPGAVATLSTGLDYIELEPRSGSVVVPSAAGSLPAYVEFTSPQGTGLRAEINLVGRTSVCAPAGSSVGGYRTC